MVSPEWSPDESYLAKLERLAFALVRKKPPKEVSRLRYNDRCLTWFIRKLLNYIKQLNKAPV